jgi:cellulose synthase/poly-beta-1,6-N-acetylglucosamine synthase-like glycosyltransferase
MTERLVQASVVIPAFNAEATIETCVRALQHQTEQTGLYEVLLVDDGSVDRTANLALACGARVLRLKHVGRAAARNEGVRAAEGSIVLFTDADCEPASDWVEQMIAPLSDPAITGTKGVYRTRQSDITARFVQLEYEDRYDHAARTEYVDFVDTYAAAYRRQALLDIGGFDATLPFDEDQELSFRLSEAGHRMVFVPQAAVYHQHPEGWRNYAVKKLHIAYWKRQVLRRHPDKALRDTHTPWTLKAQIVLAALSVLLAAVSLLLPGAAWLLVAELGAFVATTVPFLRKAWHRDRPVAWIAVPALYVRAWSLGIGFVAGLVASGDGKRPEIDSPPGALSGQRADQA